MGITREGGLGGPSEVTLRWQDERSEEIKGLLEQYDEAFDRAVSESIQSGIAKKDGYTLSEPQLDLSQLGEADAEVLDKAFKILEGLVNG